MICSKIVPEFAKILMLSMIFVGIACGTNSSAYKVEELDEEPVYMALDVPSYEYGSIAWLGDGKFAVTYEPTGFNSELSRLGLIDITDGTLIDLAESVRIQPAGDPCVPNKEREVQRIDSFRFSFIQGCAFEEKGLIQWHRTLFLFDIQSQQRELIQEFPRSNRIINVDFTVPRGRVVVAQGGPPVKSQLFLLDPESSKPIADLETETKRLLASYRSVRSPSWSVSGEITVFASGDGAGDFEDAPTGLLSERVDIVSVDPDGLQKQVLVEGLTLDGMLEWAPDGSRLAFGAAVKGTSGIWILDGEAKTIRQVWSRNEYFNWSPDGKSIVILDDPDGGSTFEDPFGEDSPLPHSPIVIEVGERM